jgi:hypothetical protein
MNNSTNCCNLDAHIARDGRLGFDFAVDPSGSGSTRPPRQTGPGETAHSSGREIYQVLSAGGSR